MKLGNLGFYDVGARGGRDFSMANLVGAVVRESEYDLHKINSSKE